MRLLKLHILQSYNKYVQIKRGRVVKELAVLWVFVAVVISLLVLLGVELRRVIKQIKRITNGQFMVVKQKIHLGELAKITPHYVREVLCGLQAEKAHVEQLQRKVRLLEMLQDDLQAQLKGK